MKHVDCSCAECRRSAAPTATITIPLAAIPAVIAESIDAVLEARAIRLHRYTAFHLVTLDQKDEQQLFLEIANNTAAALQGLDETPMEPLPAPVPQRRGARR